jgi:uncharacterized protein YqjF (DUF2071 family)
MLPFLKNHPFAVDAYFKSSHVLTYAVPKAQLERLIPECLDLDTFDDKWGFVAVAMVQTKHLRPKGFPKIMGNDFFLIGYRIFVRFKNSKNKILRGLYILKSETDQKKMQFFGNLFTHYNYTTTDITMVENQESLEIRSEKSNFYIQLSKEFNNVDLPKNSPFSEWKEARRFAGPLPFTFTYDDKKKEVLVIEGVRSNWKPRAINVIDHDFEFIKSMGFQGAVLASAFVINDIPYSWKSGKIESWKKP